MNNIESKTNLDGDIVIMYSNKLAFWNNQTTKITGDSEEMKNLKKIIQSQITQIMKEIKAYESKIIKSILSRSVKLMSESMSNPDNLIKIMHDISTTSEETNLNKPIKILYDHKIHGPANPEQAKYRQRTEEMYKNITEPHCKICGDTEEQIYELRTETEMTRMCETCYNIQMDM